MDFLEQITARTIKLDLSALQKKEKQEVLKRFEDGREKPKNVGLSKEAQRQVEAAFDDIAAKR